MILPLWGQGCVVTFHGEQCLGTCQGAYVSQAGKYEGEYVVNVHSGRWGYALEFPARAVRLLVVTYADGEIYNAEEAFLNKYSSTEIFAMGRKPMQVKVNESGRLEVDNSNLQSSAGPRPRRAALPVAAPTVTRRVRRG